MKSTVLTARSHNITSIELESFCSFIDKEIAGIPGSSASSSMQKDRMEINIEIPECSMEQMQALLNVAASLSHTISDPQHTKVVSYIDPGTGSMLFSIIIGVAASGVFLFRSLIIKLKFMSFGKKNIEKDSNKIPYVIFAESKRYWNVFQPICKEFEQRKIRCEYWTTSKDDPAFQESFEFVKPVFIGEGTKAFAKLNMMNADICVSTTPGLDVLQWKRSKDVRKYVHVFHALDAGNGYRMFGLDYYDAVLMCGANCEENIRELENLRNLPAKELTIVGSTYMDALLERRNALPENGQKKTDVKTVLLAPSWGTSSTLNRFGEKIIDSLIATGYRIVIRPHPQTKTSDPEMLAVLQAKYPDSDMLQWNFDRDNFNVLNEADLMISDFSGVILDYTLVFDRPILYLDTSFDTAPYDLAWSSKEYWNIRVLPKLGKQISEEDFPELKQIIDSMIDAPAWKQGRDEVRAEAWHNIGEAAKRTVDYLTKEEK